MARVGNVKRCRQELSVFVEGSFDYAHFLPDSERCFPLHGHTSTALLELRGAVGESGMVIDFTEAKALLNDALSLVDHKLVASRAHSKRAGGMLVIEYRKFIFRLPAEHVFLLDGEGTCENIAQELGGSIMEKVPAGVSLVRLTITEGLRKGSSVELERCP